MTTAINLKRIMLLALAGALSLASAFAFIRPAAAVACVRSAPTAVISPSDTQTGAPGDALTYDLVVTNNDSVECGSTYFSFDTSQPFDWSGEVNTIAYGLIAPGESFSAQAIFVSDGFAADGTYEVDALATQLDESYNVVGTATFPMYYTVKAPIPVDTKGPTVHITSPQNGTTLKRNTSTVITAIAYDLSGVSSVHFYVDGALLCSGTATSCAWHVPNSKGSHTIWVLAADIYGNTGGDAITVNVK